MMLFFFFQAEDGIRDVAVTGVQTCALPIYFPAGGAGAARRAHRLGDGNAATERPARLAGKAGLPGRARRDGMEREPGARSQQCAEPRKLLTDRHAELPGVSPKSSRARRILSR